MGDRFFLPKGGNIKGKVKNASYVAQDVAEGQTKGGNSMIRHISSIAEIVDDLEETIRFYREVLGLEVKHEAGSGYALVEVEGTLHFGIWERGNAAVATFGDRSQKEKIPLGFSIGYEVDAVEGSVDEIEARGWSIIHPRKEETWGQVTARFYSPSGALCEFSEMPKARRITQELKASDD
jgi:catechol 2,3-dioxygenase-like lactoylglutathione lyase family enzyme